MTRMLFATALFVSLTASCSWSRFDDVRKDPPVVVLDRAGNVESHFGISLASGPGSAALLVGGDAELTQGALYAISEDPADAPSRGVCTDGENCRLLGRTAYVANAAGTDCFVHGVGRTGGDLHEALLGSCESGTDFSLAVPDVIAKRVVDVVLSTNPGDVTFTDILGLGSDGTILAAGSPDAGIAWVYDATGNLGATITAPIGAADGTFGASVATVKTPSAQIVAVASPGNGHVHLFALDGAAATYRGCFAKPAPWGVVMIAASSGNQAAIVVSDAIGTVDVIDVTKLPASTECGAPPSIHTVSCIETDDVTGCGSSDFGYGVAAADVNGDGTLELLIGAPGLSVRGLIHGGAVEVFDLFGASSAMEDTLFDSSAEAGDRLGSSVAGVRVAGRDVVAAGMPGTGRQGVALFYCSKLAGKESASARCQ